LARVWEAILDEVREELAPVLDELGDSAPVLLDYISAVVGTRLLDVQWFVIGPDRAQQEHAPIVR
jgi:hypothetical protein